MTTVKKELFNSIVLSKKLSNILTAYFHEDQKTSFNDLLKNHQEMFQFWAHESNLQDDPNYTYSSLVTYLRNNYNTPVDFTVTDRKIMTGYDETYGSWINIGHNGIFIIWNLTE